MQAETDTHQQDGVFTRLYSCMFGQSSHRNVMTDHFDKASIHETLLVRNHHDPVPCYDGGDKEEDA